MHAQMRHRVQSMQRTEVLNGTLGRVIVNLRVPQSLPMNPGGQSQIPVMVAHVALFLHVHFCRQW